ncbi:MAG TPA: hypothetical protein VLP43_12190 [Solirubrobacteraceae bacterium]|nr:hypothetical protein [Solirubrobacteraceae bacterium]
MALAIVLALRHRSPLRALAAVLAFTLLIGFGPIVVPAVLLSLFTVAEYCERRQVIRAGSATAVVVLIDCRPRARGNV